MGDLLTIQPHRLSYVTLIAPSTTENRMKILCGIADSFIYLVSRMGVTGATGSLNADLPAFIKRVKELSGNVPVAVGFGISTREHFKSVTSVADGAVIGSQIIAVLADAPAEKAARAVENYCSQITERNVIRDYSDAAATAVVENSEVSQEDTEDATTTTAIDGTGRFGVFGGQYVPEALTTCLAELEAGFQSALENPAFWEEYRSYYPYMGRPSTLHLAHQLTEQYWRSEYLAKTGGPQPYGLPQNQQCPRPNPDRASVGEN